MSDEQDRELRSLRNRVARLEEALRIFAANYNGHDHDVGPVEVGEAASNFTYAPRKTWKVELEI